MDSSLNNIKLFSNENLVKFMEKIGHHGAARIVQDYKLDGQKLLELTETETLEWKLTEFQRDLFWNCISQIKSIPLRNLDIVQQKHLKKILNEEKTCSNSKEGRSAANFRKKYQLEDNVSSNEVFTVYGSSNEPINNAAPQNLHQKKTRYLKFREFKKQETHDVPKYISLENNQNVIKKSLNSNQNLGDTNNHMALKRFDNHGNKSRESFYFSCSSSNENVLDSARKNYYRESEYIYGPCLEGTKDNNVVDRIKKYVKFNPRRKNSTDDNDELLKNSDDVYLELCDLKDSMNSSKCYTEANIYDEAVCPADAENSQLSEEKATKETPVHFMINLCCFSCYAGCTKKGP